MSMTRQDDLTVTLCLDKTLPVSPDPERRTAAMPDLPSHPDSAAGEAAEPPPDSSRPPGARRLRAAVIAAVVIVVLVIIVLHVTGVVGAGTNG
jgi:hypothetical protein